MHDESKPSRIGEVAIGHRQVTAIGRQRVTAARHRRVAVIAAATTMALAMMTLTSCGSSDSGVTLNFFQFKPEAVAQFDDIIAGFEKENPGINVIQNHVPEADTAIRTLLVKNKVPDVMTLNANATYGELANVGVFADVESLPAFGTVAQSPVDIVNALGRHGSETNGVPFALAASGILYNKEIFAEHNLEVPDTWDELIAICDELQAAGVTPFYGSIKDQWTILPTFNNLGGALQPKNFFDDLRAEGGDVGPDSMVSFSKNYRPVAEKLKKLFSYNQSNRDSRDYNAANKAFAEGESAMYLMGTFAITPITENNPEIDLGSFPYPSSNDSDENVLVTGVDVVLAIGRETPHKAEAEKFIDYMMRPENVDAYGKAQATFSPLRDAKPSSNPYLAGLNDFVQDGRIVGYIDHQIPPAIMIQPLLQQFIIDGDTDKFLTGLDSEWRKVAARSTQR